MNNFGLHQCHHLLKQDHLTKVCAMNPQQLVKVLICKIQSSVNFVLQG